MDLKSGLTVREESKVQGVESRTVTKFKKTQTTGTESGSKGGTRVLKS